MNSIMGGPDWEGHEAMKRTDKLRLEVQQLKDEVAALQKIIQALVCHKCGKVSWDVTLEDYCSCESQLKGADPLGEMIAGGSYGRPRTE